MSKKENEDKEPIWFEIRESVTYFTALSPGRQDILNEVDSCIQKGVVLISGLGGVGKSELAIKYARDHSQDYDGNVIWINAESYRTLAQSFLRLAQKLGISQKDIDGNQKDIKSIVENVYGFFSKRKSLFIFDNAQKLRTADGDEGIHTFLPSLPSQANKPYILITSRNQDWVNIKVIKLDIFTENEATDFIKKALNREQNKNEIQNVMKKIQYFPLALQQAVAYINKSEKSLNNVGSKFEISDYLKRYDEETKTLLEFPDNSNNLYTQTTFTTWRITIDGMNNNENGKQARKILDILAYFSPDNIPVQIFLGLELIGDNEEKLGDAIQLLKQYSMVNSGQEQTLLNVHRLVQQVTRIELEMQENRRKLYKPLLDF